VQNFMQLVGHADFLCPIIWSRVFARMRFHDGSESESVSYFVQISEKNYEGGPNID
jgi:hypothetical protein